MIALNGFRITFTSLWGVQLYGDHLERIGKYKCPKLFEL